MVATVIDSLNKKQLLFLQRMIMADEEASQLDIYIGNLGTITPENVLFQMDECVKNEYAYQLLLDSIILVNLANEVTRKSYEIIANISAFLHVGKKDLKEISMVAATLLKKNIECLTDSVDVVKIDRRYGFYLCEVPTWCERAKKGYIEKLVNLLSKRITVGETSERKEVVK